jgi:hypothetical protein
MTSERKIRANRANARASTGPKTARGRVASASNALRHGFSLPVYSDSALSEEVEALARQIAGTDAAAEIQELARRVAEAQVDLRRVRFARHRFLSDALSEPYYESRAVTRAKVALLSRLLQLGAGNMLVPAAVEKVLTSTSEGPHNFAFVLSQERKGLFAMDRYERRALSRRRFAIRAFDDARRRSETADCSTWNNN